MDPASKHVTIKEYTGKETFILVQKNSEIKAITNSYILYQTEIFNM